jgi:ribosomal protein L11 methyltransferase
MYSRCSEPCGSWHSPYDFRHLLCMQTVTMEATIQLNLAIPREEYDALVAVLSGIGYYAFEETPAVLKAFIMESDYSEAAFDQTVKEFFPDLLISKTLERIEPKDWNAEWEANFHSVTVGDFCEVHPPHRTPDPSVRHHVMVAPKMAFGTGHHATTWLVVDVCSRLDFPGKTVLDMGCGTGVLGILARKLGASPVTCIDVDPWSEENTRENMQLNGLEDLEVILGDATAIPDRRYQIILANINRNVLMADRDRYVHALAEGGVIAISGFFDFDEAKLYEHFVAAGLLPVERRDKDNWVMLAFKKPQHSAHTIHE